MRRVVGQIGRRCTRARAEDETEGCVKTDVGDQLHQLVKVFFGLTGKTDDEIRAHGDVRSHGAQFADRAFVFHGGVTAFHGHQNTVAAVLHRQMQMADELRHLGIHVHQALREFIRVAGGVTDALHTGNLGDVFDQQSEIGDLGGAAHAAPVGIHVLTEQGDFFHALGAQTGHLGHHIV